MSQNGESTMASVFHDQYEFLQAGDVTTGKWTDEHLAFQLITEEYEELKEKPYLNYDNSINDINSIKEALDLMYVTAQYLNVTIGPDKAKEAWDMLHTNNMSKCHKGTLLKREDGKILKPDDYQPLDLSTVLGV